MHYQSTVTKTIQQWYENRLIGIGEIVEQIGCLLALHDINTGSIIASFIVPQTHQE